MTAIHSEIRAKAHDTRSENWRRKIDSIFSRRFSAPAFRAKACPHLFPKTATLYPETGDFVCGSRRFCILKQATSLSETATLYPETGDFRIFSLVSSTQQASTSTSTST